MNKIGFHVLGNAISPIVPILLKNERLTHEFAEEMMKEGIYVVGFSYPVVPKNHARIRVQLSAAHSSKHIKIAVDTFEKIGKKFKLI